MITYGVSKQDMRLARSLFFYRDNKFAFASAMQYLKRGYLKRKAAYANAKRA